MTSGDALPRLLGMLLMLLRNRRRPEPHERQSMRGRTSTFNTCSQKDILDCMMNQNSHLLKNL